MSLKDALKLVPQKPGSYQMLDRHGVIIYVGKAKNLKARLTSYFTGSHDHKTTKMITLIDRFDYIVTNTEIEALILELDLIKKHQPRFNILLRDDKSYPYIEITKEKHPKLQVTRRVNRNNKNLFGPYPNAKAARETLKILNQLYPLRKCQTLPKEPCLYYHIGQCMAPCIKPVEPETYQNITQEIVRFLKGDVKGVVDTLKEKMHAASENLAFERAQEYKEAMTAIELTTQKQAMQLHDTVDRDVIALAYNNDHVAIEFFFVRAGKIAATDKKLAPYYLDALDEALSAILQFYEFYPKPKEILINEASLCESLEALLSIPINTPQRGVKKQMMDVALMNAVEALDSHDKQLQATHDKTFGALDELSELLGIPTPYRIEAFDNSHIKGEYPVSGMVVFVNGLPDRQSYRKFKLEDSDRQRGDTEMMEEVIYRRYRRVLMDQLTPPNLIVVDGGIHQINVTRKVLQDLHLDIPFVGLAKSKDHKTSYLLDADGATFELKKNSALYRLLGSIQDEVHRFTLTFHQHIRGKAVFESILDTIEGVGEQTKKKLLETFKTIDHIANASEESLKKLGIPQKTIERIHTTLRQKESS